MGYFFAFGIFKPICRWIYVNIIKITCKLDLPASINNHKIRQKVIKMSHFAICHAKSEIKSNEGTLGTPALNPHWPEL